MQLAGTHKDLAKADLDLLDRYWRADNYLGSAKNLPVGQSAAQTAPAARHIKPRLLGHWGTTPGLNFIYAHLNGAIRASDLNVIYTSGPGHGGPGMVANTYLEGTYTEIYPEITRDADGLRKLFRQFSFPAAFRATRLRKRPARFMKAANSATCWCMPMALPSTIRT